MSEPQPSDSSAVRGAVEAVLFVADEPLAPPVLAEAVQATVADVQRALDRLRADYAGPGRGLDLREVAGGWRMFTRDDHAAAVERYVLDGQQTRLTQAALETLAVVAYKQPVTRSRVSAIRGVNVDGVVRTLATRGLVEEAGSDPETGAHLYRTTRLFLERLGLRELSDLPPLAPLLPDDLDELAEPRRA